MRPTAEICISGLRKVTYHAIPAAYRISRQRLGPKKRQSAGSGKRQRQKP